MYQPEVSVLERYAKVVIELGVNLQPGQRLILRAPVETAPFARLIARAAYKRGARFVDIHWSDDAVTRTRFQFAPRDSFEEYPVWRAKAWEEGARRGDAFVTVYAEDPDLLGDQDPALVAQAKRTAQAHLRPYYELLDENGFNWCAVSVPIEAWARKVFPPHSESDSEPAPLERLWTQIQKAVRIDGEDPSSAWAAHLAALKAREEILRLGQFQELHFSGPGTDLRVGLPVGHLWVSGVLKTKTGIEYVANMPTEEIFTLPHCGKCEGRVTATKPLSYGGIAIEGFGFEFEGGRVVKAWAQRGEDTLHHLLDTDEGASRLGEVALVPESSPIAQSGLLFYNTLFDENAASHLALGKAYPFCMDGGESILRQEFAARGINDSLTHVDFMIGSRELSVDGVTTSGVSQPLMRAGEWMEKP